MSGRVTRLLLRLYPPRFRRRYGDEIRDLSHELRTRSEISRARLLQDLALSALAVRRPFRRSQLTAAAGIAAIATAVLSATGTLATSSPTHRAPISPQLSRKVRPLTAQASKSGSCFIDAASTCSLSACTQFVEQRSVTAHALRVVPLAPARPRPRCLSNPRPQQERPVYVDAYRHSLTSGTPSAAAEPHRRLL